MCLIFFVRGVRRKFFMPNFSQTTVALFEGESVGTGKGKLVRTCGGEATTKPGEQGVLHSRPLQNPLSKERHWQISRWSSASKMTHSKYDKMC